MKIAKKIKGHIRKYLAYIGILMILFMLALLLRVDIKKIVIITLLIIIASICKVYKQFTSISIGFEVVTPITILFAYRVGIFFAIASSIFMVISSEFISGRMNGHSVSIQIIIYLLLSIIAGLFSATAFIPLALVLIVLRNVILWIVMVIMGFVDPFRATMATVPNIFINGFIVNSLGLIFINLL
jgi:hypothetical protein